MSDAETLGQVVKVDTGTKVLDATLQASMGALRERAKERLRKRGLSLVGVSRGGAYSFTIVLRGPYTVCWLATEYGSVPVTAIGVAKRNPIDRRNLSVGATLAVYRAWRDFWVQAARLEEELSKAQQALSLVGVRVDLVNVGPTGPVPEQPRSATEETLERVHELMAETPF